MKIIIDKSSLLKPLNHIQSVVERKNTIPILSNVIIVANDDKLSLSATDMDIDILEYINCNVINFLVLLKLTALRNVVLFPISV